MKISCIFLFCVLGIASVYARTFRGGSFSSGSLGKRSTTKFGNALRFGSSGKKPSFGYSGGKFKEFAKPESFVSVAGVPCEYDGTCVGNHQVCVDHLNMKLCFLKCKEGDSCASPFDLCEGSVCRSTGLKRYVLRTLIVSQIRAKFANLTGFVWMGTYANRAPGSLMSTAV